MRYIGYCKDEEIPFKQGETVIIPKGVSIKSTHPTVKRKVAGTTRRVKINHILCGMNDYDGKPHSNPSVVWAGTGGYWHEVDINDILEANGR
jgi:hypothetical protein